MEIKIPKGWREIKIGRILPDDKVWFKGEFISFRVFRRGLYAGIKDEYSGIAEFPCVIRKNRDLTKKRK